MSVGRGETNIDDWTGTAVVDDTVDDDTLAGDEAHLRYPRLGDSCLSQSNRHTSTWILPCRKNIIPVSFTFTSLTGVIA